MTRFEIAIPQKQHSEMLSIQFRKQWVHNFFILMKIQVSLLWSSLLHRLAWHEMVPKNHSIFWDRRRLFRKDWTWNRGIRRRTRKWNRLTWYTWNFFLNQCIWIILGKIPTSCCNDEGKLAYPTNCGKSFDQAPLSTYSQFIYQKVILFDTMQHFLKQGCSDAMFDRLTNSLDLIILLCVIFCTSQLLGVVLSMTLCCCVNKTKY